MSDCGWLTIEDLIPPNAFYTVLRGSIAHGTYIEAEVGGIDDIDMIGFVVAPIEYYLGLYQWHKRGTHEVKRGKYDLVWYEARKAVSLLLQGNPNVISSLWSPIRCCIHIDDSGRALRAMRESFLGKHLYKPFAGYATGQMKRMTSYDRKELEEYLSLTEEMRRRGIHPNQQDRTPGCRPEDPGSSPGLRIKTDDELRTDLRRYHKGNSNIGYLGDKRKRLVLQHGYDTKNASHLIRLLRMCVEVLRDGHFNVDRRLTGDAKQLIDIKQGKWGLQEVKELAESLFAQAKWAYESSVLPEEPNRLEVEEWLVRMLRERFG